MKKVLLATTALVATAGFAAADIKITGSAAMGLKYSEDRASAAVAAAAATVDATSTSTAAEVTPAVAAVKDNSVDDIIIDNEIDFNIVASGTSDSGVSFGASVDLDSSEADQRTSTGSVGDPEVYVSYNGFKLTLGAVGNAGVVLNTGDVGYQGIDSNSYTDVVDSNDGKWYDMDVHASYSVAGVSIAASVGSDSDDMGISVSGEMSGVSFAIGHATDGASGSDVKHTSLGLGYTAGAINVEALYVMEDLGSGATDDTNYMGVALTYTSGAMTLRAAMSDSDADNTDASYGLGVAYDLGGGLAVKGAFGSVGDKSRADLGLTMSF